MGAILASRNSNVYPDTITSVPVSSASGGVISVHANAAGPAVGVSLLPGGPFHQSSLVIQPGSSTIYMLPGVSESSGSIALLDFSDGSVDYAYYSVLREQYSLADTHSDDIFTHVSSFFDLFEDRDYLLRYWNTWQLTDDDMESIIHDADINDSIIEMNAFNTRRNMVFAFDYRTMEDGTDLYPYKFSLPFEVESIPSMYDMVIKSNRVVLLENTDYITSGSSIYFKYFPARSGEILTYFCKAVKIDVSAPKNNYGVLLEMEDRSSENYLAALRALWYAYWNGPTPENIGNAISVACGIPVSQEQAVVLEITGTSLTLSNGQVVNIPSGVYPLVQKGQLVGPFKALLDGVKVYDRTSKGTLDGTSTVSVSGTSVVGNGTIFFSNFSVGDRITVTTTSGVESRAVSAIISNTLMTTEPFTGTATNAQFTRSLRYLDMVYIRTLFRLFNKPTIYDALVALHGENAANEWMKANLQWHVHVIDVDLDKVLQMDKFYCTVLVSLISKFRPKQDFAIAIFRGKIATDTFTFSEAFDAIGAWDLRYTVSRNPASHFNTGLVGMPDQDDYRADPTGYSWADIDAQVFVLDEGLSIYPVSGGVSGDIALFPLPRMRFGSGISNGVATVDGVIVGGSPLPMYAQGWALGTSNAEGFGIMIGSNQVEKIANIGEDDV